MITEKIKSSLLLFLLTASAFASGSLPRDTGYAVLKGMVRDKETRTPIVFASVYLAGTGTGTVTNTEGFFTLKIPNDKMNGKIGVSCLGYKNLEIPIPELQKVHNEVQLEMNRYLIQEVTVRQTDPVQMIRDARKKVPDNYGETPVMLTAFYRETIRQNRSYTAVSEAVFDVYKAAYSHTADNDRVKIYKGRKSQDVSKMDTVLFKLQGGPYYLFLLDIVKNPEQLIDEENINYYSYSFAGSETIDDREVYVIQFDQKKNVSLSLYKGKIYIDVNTLAFTGFDFQLSPDGLEYAPESMIKKKPAGMTIEIPGAEYTVKYRLFGGRWYLSYARMEARFRCKWNRKLFRSTYTTVAEMAVTGIDTLNIVKYKTKESTRPSDVFTEQVNDFQDPEFWGDYNIIRPEESIEDATRKLAKKLDRQ